jgi:PAS domain S-box-containing protein
MADQPQTFPLPNNEPERLAALHRYQILDTPPEPAFDRLTQLVAQIFNVPTVLISLVDESRAWFKSCVGFGDREVTRANTLCSFAVLTDEPLIVTNAQHDPRFACNPLVQQEPGVRFYAGAPLLTSDGFNLGTLCLLDTQPREPFTPQQLAILIDFAAIVVDELELRIAVLRRAESEAVLQQSEEKYRTLFESIDEGFCVIEMIFNNENQPIDYRFLVTNPAFDRQTGKTNVQGKTVREIAPQHEDYWFKIYGNIALTGESVQFSNYAEEFQRWYEVHAFRVGKSELRQVGILFNDITERKQVEAELQQKSAILNLINESAPTPIFVKDRQGRIIYANPATLEVLGRPAAEVIGYRDCDLYPNPEDAALVMENDRRVMESGQTQVVEESPDGVRTFLGIKAPYWNEMGEVIGLIGVSNDISDRIQIEQDRERILQQEQAARETAEQANRIKDEFLAVLSHELRSPLNPILGWSKLLLSGKLSADRTKQALLTIERNAKLQSELIEDLLDVSRILQGKLSLNYAPVNLASTVSAAIETVQLAAIAKTIQIKTVLDQDIGQVMGDSTRLQQVVWNLLSNAVKFSPVGSQVEVKLEHTTSSLSTYAQIIVSDNGKGITPSFLPHVFDYFRQADSATTRKFGGLGLGLAIVRHLVELHGGTVTVDSPGEDRGATFTVRLPVLKAEGQGPRVESCYDFPLPSASDLLPLQNVQILVVDDEADSREFIAFVLEQGGAKVVTAASAAAAFAQLLASPPDVLVSDVGMPELDGYGLIQQVRTLPSERGGQVKAIALTAYAGDFNQRQALLAGFHRHLAKPIEPETLIQEVVSLINPSSSS